MPKCPVCKTDFTTQTACSVCGFTELTPTFLSKEEADYWTETVVVPYRKQWQQSDVWRTLRKEDELWTYSGNAENVIIPDRFKTIGSNAFGYGWGDNGIRRITIPKSIKRIKEDGIRCRNLKELIIQGTWFVVEPHALGLSDPIVFFENLENRGYPGFGSLYGFDEILNKSLRNLPRKKYWKGEWHYDAQGNPVPNEKKY